MVRKYVALATVSLFFLAAYLPEANGFIGSNGNHNGKKMRIMVPSLFRSCSTNQQRNKALLWPWMKNTNARPSSSFSFKKLNRGKRMLSLALYAKKDDDNDAEKNKDDSSAINEKLNEWVQKWKSKTSKTLIELWNAILAFAPNLKIAVSSFVVGAVIGIGAILVPVYNSVDTMTEPVTLFETILTDLDRGYVDNVDTKKLFETGVSAMLRSLDPYTEFESKQEAADLTETVKGKYGGIGLVISGSTAKNPEDMDAIIAEEEAGFAGDDIDDGISPISSNVISSDDANGESDEDTLRERLERKKALTKAKNKGISVVGAFEGYAYDYGMRVGDKIVAVDGERITPSMNVEQVRNRLRGEPGTNVDITFERIGVSGETTLSIPRTLVQIRDVKLTTLIGKPENGVGYIQLSGFASNAGREVRSAILALQAATEEASGGQNSLQSLILDLRGNPGGLLTSAVDVASCFVPKGSDIVSARGRGFPAVLYRSRIDPVLDPSTKLAVLVNGQTASAAEIVSGAIQDLDVGVIIGQDRTFGKGLVQNVEDLPFDTALKFTVAKYYTPSGRCIQSTNYREGGGLKASNVGYTASKVADKDKSIFYTKNGREVQDGGGVEADFKVVTPKASALEVTLLRSGVFSDYAAEWSKKHELSNSFSVDDDTYKDFQNYVMKKQNDGDIKLEAFYSGTINELKKALKLSGYKGSSKELDHLKADIVREMERDFQKYRSDIKEDISQNILARYLPESLILERSLRTDQQVIASVKLLNDQRQFNKLLSRTETTNDQEYASNTVGNSINTATSENGDASALRFKMEW